jgi:hypothetical protein
MNNNSYSQSEACNSKMQEQTNTRIYDRNIPSQVLQPYLDVRPVMTKYSYFPIVDPRKELNVQLQVAPTFNPHKVFNPGNTKSPWSGFVTNINLESELRNQVYALQSCSQAVYVPNSKSDLYNYNFTPKQIPQTHSLLFQKEHFSEFNPNPDASTIGAGIFMNSTRVQVRDMTKQTC